MQNRKRILATTLAIALAAVVTMVVRPARRLHPRGHHGAAESLPASGDRSPDAATAAPQPAAIDGGSSLAIPSNLPKLDAEIAPPLPDDSGRAPIRHIALTGNVSTSDGDHAAQAAWAALANCGVSAAATVHLAFALAGGEIVGSSRFIEPNVSSQLPPDQRTCALAELARALAPVASDCNGRVEVEFGPPP